MLINQVRLLFLTVITIALFAFALPALTMPVYSNAQQGVSIFGNSYTMPRLRGAMTGTDITEQDIIEFGQKWKANHIRWQLRWEPVGNEKNLAEYNRWLQSALKRFDELLPVIKKAGILVVLDLHTLPGGREDNGQMRLFTRRKYQNELIRIWKDIALRYKHNKTIWAYDLVNEPVQGNPRPWLNNWHELATKLAKEIRSIDNNHAIIYEVASWSNPEGFTELKPLDVPGVVYSFHMYEPHAFTHQGIGDHGPRGVSYPAKINGEYWDKNRLIVELQPVIRFQKKHNVPIYVGEFSALRWSPGNSAYHYLKDCIDIFESYGWSWAYHAFREWDGWSVEHNQNQQDLNRAETNRKQLLLKWYELNEKYN